MKRLITIIFIATIMQAGAQAGSQPSYAAQMAQTVMTIWKDSLVMEEGKPVKWAYDQGVVLKGIEGLWLRTADKKYFDYIQKSMDFFVDDKGDIRTYKASNYNIDNVLPGRNLLMLYNVTLKEKYYKAAAQLREQLKTHPRTKAGGFWHKKIYPYQMWLDGLYMGEPFYAEWTKQFGDDTAFNDIARQFILMERFARDPKTGLLYHGYDESREQKWADKKTGLSPNVWGRAMGWYGMALVDVLEAFPEDHPMRDSLVRILTRFATAVVKYQDKGTGLWWDIIDMPGREKNYLEASASSMFVYALAKGVRLGYLPETYLAPAQKGYAGIIKNFIKIENGQMNLHGTVSVSGLGGEPYRDGSFDYYMKEKVVVNDPKGVGAFLMASNEVEMIPTLKIGKGKTVALDYFFNHEIKKDITGKTIQYHYVWNQMDNGGFSLLGNIFNRYGVKTKSLTAAPTAQNLKGSDIYIIVDPDTEKESTSPNYIQPQHIDAIYNWVKGGGVLLLFANDSANVELKHFNQLAERFGIHFNEANPRNMVKNDYFPAGTFTIEKGNAIFKTAHKVYLKEISTLKISTPAKSVLSDNGDVIIAVSKVGKGTVFAVGDPWIYNEYLDGRKLPAELENFKATEDIVQWAIDQTKK
jgi:unsaturated rhamnogalacturonyl hydrolase